MARVPLPIDLADYLTIEGNCMEPKAYIRCKNGGPTPIKIFITALDFVPGTGQHNQMIQLHDSMQAIQADHGHLTRTTKSTSSITNISRTHPSEGYCEKQTHEAHNQIQKHYHRYIDESDTALDRPRIHLQVEILQLISWGQQGLLTLDKFQQVCDHLHKDSYYKDPRPPPHIKYRTHGQIMMS
eukprot:134283-Heterocapsa_arctica.AAC.1